MNQITVVITRPLDQAEPFAAELSAQGIASVILPTIGIQTAPIYLSTREICSKLASFGWIVFSSLNAARCLREVMLGCELEARLPETCRIAAQGEATDEAIFQAFGRRADLLPEISTSAGLLRALEETGVQGTRVLLPVSEIGGVTLPEGLARSGAQVVSLEVYRNVTLALPEEELKKICELEPSSLIFSFFSPSAFRSLLGGLQMEDKLSLLQNARIASIGPVTSEAIREAGFEVAFEPAVQSQEALIELLRGG